LSSQSQLEQVLRLLKPRKALHIGASYGQEAGLYHTLGIETWHIEPIPQVFELLQNNLAGLAGQHPVHACLSSEAGLSTTFHIANNDGLSSSLLPLGRHRNEYPSITYEKEIVVNTETVNSLIEKQIIDPGIDFILIDAQGAERLILEGATNLLRTEDLKGIIVETAVIPLYEGGSTYLEIAEILAKHDLHLQHAAFNTHGWTDAIFMKPYWRSAMCSPSIDSASGDNTEEKAVTESEAESNESTQTPIDYKFFLRNESAIAETTEFCPWDKPAFEEDMLKAINLLIPSACAHELIRIGGDADGSYLIPNDLQAIEACFSPGVSNIILFEKELAERYSIPSYLCDASVEQDQLDLNNSYHQFNQVWLGGYDGENTQSLDSWVAESNHCESNNLILQMDIEGAEFSSLMAASDSTLSRFRIAVIEFHWLWRIQSSRFLNTRFLPTLQKLSKHFDCVHAHANNCCGTTEIANIEVPNVLELTFYRKDCNSAIHQPLIPHPLDILNLPQNPPIVLGWPWTIES
jgi:FkbM family methyltransferase